MRITKSITRIMRIMSRVEKLSMSDPLLVHAISSS
jgi:hypothetical protein